jgi:hypothetical protein
MPFVRFETAKFFSRFLLDTLHAVVCLQLEFKFSCVRFYVQH